MIVISENNFTPLKEIKKVENKDINTVIYTSIYNNKTIDNLVYLLNDLFLVNNLVWFADNPNIKLNENLKVNIFPNFLDHIRKDVEKIVGFSYNSCLISINKLSDKNHNIIFKDKNFLQDTVSTIILGSDISIKIDSEPIFQNIKLKNGSLLVKIYPCESQQPKNDYFISPYNVSELNSDKSSYYTLTFLRKYLNDDIVNLDIKKGKLSYTLDKIYLSTRQRLLLNKKIIDNLSNIHKIKEGNQCILKKGEHMFKKYINIKELIGSGNWGNVYSVYLKDDITFSYKFAIKFSRISKEDLQNPYTYTSTSWYEFWILKDIIKPLIENNICPNLPLYIYTFLCNEYSLILSNKNKEEIHPCIITMIEYASGDLKSYLNDGNFTDNELYSVLFQIMIGLHAIQMTGQIFINDIKSSNILYYNVKPGGYWQYNIDNIKFYVPNYGKMFLINDFGVSTLFNPNFQLYPNKNKKLFKLGSRYAINVDETFSPINAGLEFIKDSLVKTTDIKWINKYGHEIVSKGATYNLDRKSGQIIKSDTYLTDVQKEYLFSKGITTNPNTWNFFENPYIIPPFEFYNDVQDALRIFVGGKRTTQNGNHKIYTNISTKFRDSLKPYLGKSENCLCKNFSMSSYHVLSGSFIKKFFTSKNKIHNYTNKLNGKKLNVYKINMNIGL